LAATSLRNSDWVREDKSKNMRESLENKQEREDMKQNGIDGLPADAEIAPAANEEFAGTVNSLEKVSRSQSGWDPYEVWRTRVKGYSKLITGKHELDPLR
jgi:hypothetical protein